MSQDLQNSILVMLKLTNNFPFAFKYLDYDCIISYGEYNCGYVALTKEHPIYGINSFHSDIDIDVHGGITFNQFGDDHFYPKLNDNGETLYWLGFDCMHSGDIEIAGSWPWKCNKSPQYIAEQIFYMVDQLVEIKNSQKKYKRKITIIEEDL